MNCIFKSLIFLNLTLFSAALVAAEQRYYDVEVIIFENLEKYSRESEKWSSSVEIEYPENTIETGHPWPGLFPKEYIPKLSFKRLFRKNLHLAEQAKKIEESDSRRILLHTGWRQPGMPKDTALTVKFKRTIPAIAATPLSDSDVLQQDPLLNNSAWAPAEAGQLEGKIKVSLARYLHVDVDMIFQTQQLNTSDIYQFEDAINQEVKPVVYRLKQTRHRMRSRELHYIDNPVLGMLVLITPYKLP